MGGNVEREIRLKEFKQSSEIKQLYRLVSDFKLQEQAVRLLQNAINRKKSDAVRAGERQAFIRP